MNSKLKNAILFISIGLVMVFIYFVFIKKDKEEANLVTNTNTANTQVNTSGEMNLELSRDFLSLLLSVKNITLNDGIFTDSAFKNLRDSSILLVPDGTEGRPNPFAPIGQDINPQGVSMTESLNAFSKSLDLSNSDINTEEELLPVETNLPN